MVFFIFIQILNERLLFADSGEPGQTPLFAASDLVLHCLPMSNKKGRCAYGSLSKNGGICVLADFLTSSISSLLLFCQ